MIITLLAAAMLTLVLYYADSTVFLKYCHYQCKLFKKSHFRPSHHKDHHLNTYPEFGNWNIKKKLKEIIYGY